MNLKYNSWDKITYSIWNKIEKLNEIEDDFEKNVGLLAILADIDEDTLLSMPLPQFAKLMAETEFIKDLPTVEVKEEYVVNGNKYVIKLNPQYFTVNQWIDYNSLAGDVNNKDRLLATVLLPKGKEYGDYDIEEVIKDINDMPIVDVFAIHAFFLISFKALLHATQQYLIKKLKKMKKMKNLSKEQIQQIEHQVQQIELLTNSFKSSL